MQSKKWKWPVRECWYSLYAAFTMAPMVPGGGRRRAGQEEARLAPLEEGMLAVQDDADVAGGTAGPTARFPGRGGGGNRRTRARARPGTIRRPRRARCRLWHSCKVLPDGVLSWSNKGRFAILPVRKRRELVKSLFAETLYTGDEVIRNIHLLFEGDHRQGHLHGAEGRFPREVPGGHTRRSSTRTATSAWSARGSREARARPTSTWTRSCSLPMRWIPCRWTTVRSAIPWRWASCTPASFPGSGNIVGGKSAVIRNYARSTTDALIARCRDQGGLRLQPHVHAGLEGDAAAHPHGRALAPARTAGPGEDKAGAQAARAGTRGRHGPHGGGGGRPRHPAVRQALRVHVHKIDDIASLLRLQEEFGIRVTVEHACGVNDGRIYAA